MAVTSNSPAVVATPREGKFNKNAARRVRVSGKIPAVVYGAGQDSVAVTVDPRVITKILHSDSGHNTIFDLDVTGSTVVKAMIVDWQHEPIKGALLHIDLKRIANSRLEQLVVTNTIPLREEALRVPKIKVLSIAGLLGRAIESIHMETSVSTLFN